MKVNKFKSIIMATCVIFALVACAGFTKNAYRTLSTSATMYETSMQSLSDLHKKGIITDVDVAKVIIVAEKFWASYHISVNALVAYEKTNTAKDQKRVEVALVEFNKFLVEFTTIITPLLTKE